MTNQFASYLLPFERKVLENARDQRPLLSGYDDGAAFKQETGDAYKAMREARDLLLVTGMLGTDGSLSDKGRTALERAHG